jgi:DNA-binding winged helix-turn-helix (wHTH) protein
MENFRRVLGLQWSKRSFVENAASTRELEISGGTVMKIRGDARRRRFTQNERTKSLHRKTRKSCVIVALRPKGFAVLHLVENAGRLLSTDRPINMLWPIVIATEASLARCVSDIRLVRQDSDRRIMKTVTGRGYLFAAPVSLHSGVAAE